MSVGKMEERRGDVDTIEQDDEFIGEWELRPLTPRYQESHHSPYVEALNDCLKNTNIHNIALSGGYGVGKSSILSRFA
ncbi:MAG: KAP family NTPase, partial [Bifidobacterium crudilactis]|nr:KAP family NTPase [Bifidobacterium crudilactis]